MATHSVTRLDVRPLPGAIIENPVVSGTVYVGDAVYNSGSASTTGGSVSQANGGATATAYAIGIVVAAPSGGTVAVTGDRVDVVTWGRVTGFTGLNAGTPTVFVGNSAGVVGDAAGTVSHKLGVVRDSTTIFVQPELH